MRTALDAREALWVLVHGAVDSVLVDYRLPGNAGPELCKQIKVDPETAAIPAIMLTSEATVEVASLSAAAGAHAFFAKPPELERSFFEMALVRLQQ